MSTGLTKIRYCALGAVSEIGASAHYLQLDRWGILLDAGLDPHRNGSCGVPEYDLINQHPLQAILISHAHLDHIGSLPIAIQNFPHARVYMTPSTAELTDRMLHHYLQVYRKQKREKWISEPELFSEEFLENIRYLYQSFNYEFPFPLHGHEESHLQFSFYDAGHILGSAGILIEWKGKRIFYTGNTRKSAQFILKGASYPQPPIDLLITESTYGANEAVETIKRSAEIKRFAGQLSRHLKLGGVVLLPVFALGRTQEILMLIQRLRQRGQIPAAPVYVTGFGARINRVYDKLLHKIYKDYTHGEIRRISFGYLKPGSRLRAPAILLSTSGMLLPGSPSFDFAREVLTDPRSAIFFVGYADPETPAGMARENRLENLKEIFGIEKISCGMDIFHFSAHSHRKELLSMIRNLQPRKVVLVHGQPEALEWMKEHIPLEVTGAEPIIPEPHKWYEWEL